MINKIKILCDKNKLKKLKLLPLPFLISSVLLTGCSTKTNNTQNSQININQTTLETQTNTQSNTIYSNQPLNYSSQPDKILTEEQIEMINKAFSMSEYDFNDFKEELDTEVNYKYSEYFEVDKALNKYDSFKEVDTTSNNIISNKTVDTEKLYNYVLKNNSSFLNEGVNKNIFTQFSSSELKNICTIISNVLNQKMNELEFDVAELDQFLSQLKILSYDKYEYATITTDGCLAINTKMINTMNVENAFEKVITHETMHMIQKGSYEEQQLENYSKNVGMNYSWDDLKVNSLYNDWIIEASAEKAASRITGEEVNYAKKVHYLDALQITMAFDNYNIDDLDLTKDLDKFYETFSCDGLISREEIATMMYAIDFINYGDSSSYNDNDFINNYQNKTGKILSSKESRELKYLYSSTAYRTLTKKFYYDLAEQLKNNSIKLYDAYSMITLFEVSCCNNTWFTDITRSEYNKEFISEYIQIQDEFFKNLSESSGYDQELLKESYVCFFYNREPMFSCTNKEDDFNKIYNKIKHNKISTVSEKYDLTQKTY